MQVTVAHLGGMQFEIGARQHRIACDQPIENGGFDEGMTPPELLPRWDPVPAFTQRST